jgi:hypothetical protein
MLASLSHEGVVFLDLLPSSHSVTSSLFPYLGSSDAPCSRLGDPVKMAPPFTGSAHTPLPGSGTMMINNTIVTKCDAAKYMMIQNTFVTNCDAAKYMAIQNTTVTNCDASKYTVILNIIATNCDASKYMMIHKQLS